MTAGEGGWNREMSGGRQIGRGYLSDPLEMDPGREVRLKHVVCYRAGGETEVLNLEEKSER